MFKLSRVYKSFADTPVLQDINLILHNEVVALVGENGSGKTTLLKLLTRELKPDEGQVETKGTIGYVPQLPKFKETILECFNIAVEQWRIDLALQDVDLDKAMNFETRLLSGGQKTKLSIAMALAQEYTPSTLLLDEPTNNLDRETLLWLENYVKSFNGSIVIVSHDREFINNTCTKILVLENNKLQIYSGNYDEYRKQKDLELKIKLQEYEAKIEEKFRLEEILKSKARQMQSVTGQKYSQLLGIPKVSFNGSKNAAQRNTGKQISSLTSRLKRLDYLAKPDIPKDYTVKLVGSAHDAKLIVKIDKVSLQYLPILKNIHLEIRGTERIRIAGRNGSGKSTLLKLAAGLEEVYSGEVKTGTNVSIGYLSQDIDGINQTKIAIENLQDTGAEIKNIYREARALGLLERDLKKKPSELSRGQQSKLSFAKLLLSGHDLLILDEPTNHLDIPTKERIEMAIKSYRGAILVASHDEYFIKSIGITYTIDLDNLV